VEVISVERRGGRFASSPCLGFCLSSPLPRTRLGTWWLLVKSTLLVCIADAPWSDYINSTANRLFSDLSFAEHFKTTAALYLVESQPC
jgi:hypothetical protein